MSEAFENSVRNKLIEADIPFDQDAWTKMESLLDAGENDKPLLAWWWWLLLPLLLGTGGWWMMQKSSDRPPKNNITTDITQQVEQVQKTDNHLPENIITPDKQQADQVQKTDNHLSENIITPGKQQQEAIQVPVIPAIITQNKKPENNQVNSYELPEKRVPGVAEKNNDINFLPTKNVNNLNAYTKISAPTEIPINTSSPADQTTTHPRRKINSKGLYVGITLGPDINVAPSLKYGNIGFNAGVLLHYYFNKHWFVTTGAVYSKKIYAATPSDYKVLNNGTYQSDLVRVNANCDVLDIPINANYTFLQVNNNTLSATLGMSNYFMLKEKYQYNYKYTPPSEQTVKNENQHYLAVLNVGALYQHPAGKRLIIGVQPYAKIPLRGVGYGQVKLYSAGVALQINLVGKKH
ncbi:outer membrane beta-barrel protein [Chitinophaga niastensis]|nr:outer membrane beta-barrel protein [Chitinophaga niastensis]